MNKQLLASELRAIYKQVRRSSAALDSVSDDDLIKLNSRCSCCEGGVTDKQLPKIIAAATSAGHFFELCGMHDPRKP